MLMRLIRRSGRTFVALRKAGHRRQVASVYHAVTPHCRMALCSTEPGAGSGWDEPPGECVTCPTCLQRLARINGYDLRCAVAL